MKMFNDNRQYFVKWYDYLWLLIPVAGIVMFIVSVEDRQKKAGVA